MLCNGWPCSGLNGLAGWRLAGAEHYRRSAGDGAERVVAVPSVRDARGMTTPHVRLGTSTDSGHMGTE